MTSRRLTVGARTWNAGTPCVIGTMAWYAADAPLVDMDGIVWPTDADAVGHGHDHNGPRRHADVLTWIRNPNYYGPAAQGSLLVLGKVEIDGPFSQWNTGSAGRVVSIDSLLDLRPEGAPAPRPIILETLRDAYGLTAE